MVARLDAILAWTVVGSVAGVVGADVAVIPLRAAALCYRNSAGLTIAENSVKVPGSGWCSARYMLQGGAYLP